MLCNHVTDIIRKAEHRMKKTVKCPLTGNQIDGDACYCVVLVVDGDAPEYTLPAGIMLDGEARKTCHMCEYHRDLQ